MHHLVLKEHKAKVAARQKAMLQQFARSRSEMELSTSPQHTHTHTSSAPLSLSLFLSLARTLKLSTSLATSRFALSRPLHIIAHPCPQPMHHPPFPPDAQETIRSTQGFDSSVPLSPITRPATAPQRASPFAASGGGADVDSKRPYSRQPAFAGYRTSDMRATSKRPGTGGVPVGTRPGSPDLTIGAGLDVTIEDARVAHALGATLRSTLPFGQSTLEGLQEPGEHPLRLSGSAGGLAAVASSSHFRTDTRQWCVAVGVWLCGCCGERRERVRERGRVLAAWQIVVVLAQRCSHTTPP